MDTDTAAEIGGAGLVAILLLGGGALALRRRRRNAEEMAYADEAAYEPIDPVWNEPAAEPVAEPRFARTEPLAAEAPAAVAAAPVAAVAAEREAQPAAERPLMNWDREPIQAPVSDADKATLDRQAAEAGLPEGFDLSRFGPNVRRAYLGPTPDNPSLSLKNRIRKAAAMDKRARDNGELDLDQSAAEAAPPPPQARPAVKPEPMFAGGFGSYNGWNMKPSPAQS